MLGSPGTVPPRASYGLHRRRYGPGWGPPRASPHLGRPQVGITAPGGGLCAFPIPNKAAFTADQLTHLPPIPWHSRSTRPPPPPVRASMTSIASMRALLGPLAIRISRSSARKSPLQAAVRGTLYVRESQLTASKAPPGAPTPGITGAAPARGGAHPGHHRGRWRPQVGPSR